MKKLTLILFFAISLFAYDSRPFTLCDHGVCKTYYPAVIEHQKLMVDQERLRLEQERYYKEHPEERPLSRAELQAKAEVDKKEAYKRKLAEANRKAREHNEKTFGARYK